MAEKNVKNEQTTETNETNTNNKSLTLNPRSYYILGAQYLNGPYSITDESTGEVKDGITDKWVVSVGQPFDRRKQNCKSIFGVSVYSANIPGDDMPYVIGVEPEAFRPEMVENLIGKPVQLEIVSAFDNHGKARNAIRGITLV